MFCIFNGNSGHKHQHIECKILWAKIVFPGFGSFSNNAIEVCSISFLRRSNAMFDLLKVRPTADESPQESAKYLGPSIYSPIGNNPVKTWRQHNKEVVETAKGKAIQLGILHQ